MIITRYGSGGRIDQGLHTADFTIGQLNFDAMGVGRAAGQDTHHDPLGQQAGGLVKFLDDLHPHPGSNLTSFWQIHGIDYNPSYFYTAEDSGRYFRYMNEMARLML
jgi:hypothetical protein